MFLFKIFFIFFDDRTATARSKPLGIAVFCTFVETWGIDRKHMKTSDERGSIAVKNQKTCVSISVPEARVAYSFLLLSQNQETASDFHVPGKRVPNSSNCAKIPIFRNRSEFPKLLMEQGGIRNCIVLKRLENTQIGGWLLGFGFRFGMFGFGILHPDCKAGRRIWRSLEEFGRYMLYIQNAMWRNKRFGFRYLLCQGKWLLWGLIGSDEFVGNSKIPCVLGRNALMHYANSE